MNKKMFALTVLAALLLPWPAVAEDGRIISPQEEYELCVSQFSAEGWPEGAEACRHIHPYQDERLLDETYARALKSLPPARRTKLEKAQAAWVAFRGAYIDFLYTHPDGPFGRKLTFDWYLSEMENQTHRLEYLMSPTGAMSSPDELSPGCQKCLNLAEGDQVKMAACFDQERRSLEQDLERRYKKLGEPVYPFNQPEAVYLSGQFDIGDPAEYFEELERRRQALREAYQAWLRFKDAHAQVFDYPPASKAARTRVAEWLMVATRHLAADFKFDMRRYGGEPDI